LRKKTRPLDALTVALYETLTAPLRQADDQRASIDSHITR
jgi:hypothetical protein